VEVALLNNKNKNTMKTIFLFVALALAMVTRAQVMKVSLQASGLTCSMCSNSINKALKTLDFIDKINTDMKTYTFEISFKPNSHVDFDKIKNKVENAGFTVSAFIASIYFDNVHVKAGEPVTIEDKTFYFLNIKDEAFNGIKQVKVLDKGFVSTKEFKSNSFFNSFPGTYHVSI
jgi:copper chaperone CopZ